MKQSAMKGDLGAPGGGKKTLTCTRCFARVSSDELVCTECGAPLNVDVTIPVADTIVHGDLAQANLLKMRGDLDAAEKTCLSVLKRYPNDPEAHVFLGDLSAERGEWDRASEWYELALDLSPNSQANKAKLEDAKQRIHDTQTAETVSQLGIPEPPSKAPWIIAGVLVILVAVVIGSVKFNSNHRPPPTLNAGNIVFPAPAPASTDTDNQGALPAQPSSSSESKPSPAALAGSMEDRALMQLLQQRSTVGSDVTALTQDPRDQALTVTYNVPAGEDVRKIGATLAKDALEQSTETLIVIVRGVSNDHLVFVADATRPKLTEVQSSTYQTENAANPDSWISTLFQREWTPTTSGGPAPSAPSTATSGGQPSAPTGNGAPDANHL
ncbi:MAG TPA: tetratricopeptide repeat protein [Fimbriimonas sp.]|nr:tetratricopeptide repeat protein [Fimbriimonas sp.]